MQLEGAVDPATYVVGPGDVFSLFIGGSRPISMQIPVTADGRLVLLGAGTVGAAGRTLREVRADALEALAVSYRHVRTELALLQPRQFFVHVTGAVPAPGRYTATAVSRVSSVIDQVMQGAEQSEATNPDFRPSLRHVRVHRTDSSEMHLDLLRYYATGSLAENPYLRDGDRVAVDAYDPERAAVLIDGAVTFPGKYAFRQGDTTADLLALALGTEDVPADLRVRLTRRGRTHVLAAHQFGLSVLPNDLIHVAADSARTGTATVIGALRFPGTYPITPGQTTLRDLVEAAGGFSDDALLRTAYLERQSPVRREVEEDGQEVGRRSAGRRFGYAPLDHPGAHASAYRSAVQFSRLNAFNFLQRDYVQRELHAQHYVAVNLVDVLTADAPPLPLKHGDRLVVPHDDGTIFVFGEVNRPGYVAFVPNRPAETYLQRAGARSPLAGDVFVVQGSTGRYLPAAETTIQSGDLLFVSRKRDVAPTPELQQVALETERVRLEVERHRREGRLRIVQTALTTIGTLASVVTTYLLVVRDN